MCELEDWLINGLAQPDDCLTDELVTPLLWRCNKPWLLHTCQFLGCCLINDYLYIVVLLQECCRELVVDITLDKVARDACLLLAPHHEHYLLCTHDCLKTHSDGHLGHLVRIREELILSLAAAVAQLHHACCRVLVATRLVEAYLAELAHAHNHEVYIAIHSLLILLAVVIHSLNWHCAIREVDVGRVDINKLEEILVHSVVTALWRLGRHWVELIEAVHLNIGKAYLACVIAFHQFVVKTERSAACRKAEHKGLVTLVSLDGIHHNICSTEHTLLLLRTYSCRYFLELADALY